MEKKNLVIIGAGGHGKVVADAAWKGGGYDKIIFLDDDTSLHSCDEFPVVGRSDEVTKYIHEFDVFIAVGNAKTRQTILEQLQVAKATIPVIIHPDAVLGRNVVLGAGTAIMAGAVINSGSRIGNGCIINTSASIDHDCNIQDYAHISVGARLAGSVSVGARTWIGIGACVSNNVEITSDCMIGAGSVVVRNIEETGTYIGIPARRNDMEYKMTKNSWGGVFAPVDKIRCVALRILAA